MVPQDINKMLNGALKPGEPFKFRCLQCGSCCRNREDILLNPYDLHRISGELHMAPIDVINTYCITYVGENSRIPCVLLKPKGDKKICPLLKNSRCSVHKSKPTVCALFPLGRGITLNRDNIEGMAQRERIVYFMQNTGCGARDEEHRVEEWLEEFNLQESESWFLEWARLTTEITTRMIQVEKEVSEKVMDLLFRSVFVKLYLDYPDGVGTGREFVECFKTNADQIVDLLDRALKESLYRDGT